MSFFPCPLCGRKLEKRITRNGKPYFICNYPCGLQLFIRRKDGIERLEEIFKNIEKAKIPFLVYARRLHEIQTLLAEIEGLKTEMEKLGSPLFMSEHKLRIRNSLKTQLDNLFFKLEQIGKENEI